MRKGLWKAAGAFRQLGAASAFSSKSIRSEQCNWAAFLPYNGHPDSAKETNVPRSPLSCSTFLPIKRLPSRNLLHDFRFKLSFYSVISPAVSVLFLSAKNCWTKNDQRVLFVGSIKLDFVTWNPHSVLKWCRFTKKNKVWRVWLREGRGCGSTWWWKG